MDGGNERRRGSLDRGAGREMGPAVSVSAAIRENGLHALRVPFRTDLSPIRADSARDDRDPCDKIATLFGKFLAFRIEGWGGIRCEEPVSCGNRFGRSLRCSHRLQNLIIRRYACWIERGVMHGRSWNPFTREGPRRVVK